MSVELPQRRRSSARVNLREPVRHGGQLPNRPSARDWLDMTSLWPGGPMTVELPPRGPVDAVPPVWSLFV